MTVRQYAYLLLGVDPPGDFDPDDVTALLGIEPTSVLRKGVARRPRFPDRHTLWEWRVHEREEHECHILVGEVLDMIEPRAAQLAEARHRWGVGGTVHVVADMDGAVQVDRYPQTARWSPDRPFIWFEPDLLARLSALSLSLAIFQYDAEMEWGTRN